MTYREIGNKLHVSHEVVGKYIRNSCPELNNLKVEKKIDPELWEEWIEITTILRRYIRHG